MSRAGFRHDGDISRDGNAGRHFGHAGRDEQRFLLGEESAEGDAVCRDGAVLVHIEPSNFPNPTTANDVPSDLRIRHDRGIIHQCAVVQRRQHAVATVDGRVVRVEHCTCRDNRAIIKRGGSNCDRVGERRRSYEGEQIAHHLQPDRMSGRTCETLNQIHVRAGTFLIVDRVGNVLELVQGNGHVRLRNSGGRVASALAIIRGRQRAEAGRDDRGVVLGCLVRKISYS